MSMAVAFIYSDCCLQLRWRWSQFQMRTFCDKPATIWSPAKLAIYRFLAHWLRFAEQWKVDGATAGRCRHVRCQPWHRIERKWKIDVFGQRMKSNDIIILLMEKVRRRSKYAVTFVDSGISTNCVCRIVLVRCSIWCTWFVLYDFSKWTSIYSRRKQTFIKFKSKKNRNWNWLLNEAHAVRKQRNSYFYFRWIEIFLIVI